MMNSILAFLIALTIFAHTPRANNSLEVNCIDQITRVSCWIDVNKSGDDGQMVVVVSLPAAGAELESVTLGSGSVEYDAESKMLYWRLDYGELEAPIPLLIQLKTAPGNFTLVFYEQDTPGDVTIHFNRHLIYLPLCVD